MSRLRWVAAGLCSAVAVALIASVVTLRPALHRAQSSSMAPGIVAGDLVLTTDESSPVRGDVVVFDDPGGWADAEVRLTGGVAAPADSFVKRVVAVAGDRVACCDPDGRLTVDGVPVAEPYRADSSRLASVLAFDVTVPAAHVFVLGDAREASFDSRYLGSVPETAITGIQRLVLRIP